MRSLTEKPERSMSALERAINALVHSEDPEDHKAARWLSGIYWRFDDEAREQRLSHPTGAEIVAFRGRGNELPKGAA